MKQIKGEPWPSGETLAGYRDGIQMEEPERVIHRGSGDSSALFVFSFLCFFIITLVKVAKKHCICGTSCLCDGRGGCQQGSCTLLSLAFAQTACLSPSFHIQPVGKLSPAVAHDFYLFLARF